MKRTGIIAVLLLFAVSVMAQGAGNYAFTQSKKSSRAEEYNNYKQDNLGGLGYNNQDLFQYQQAAPSSSHANDSVYYVTASVLMNVQPDSYVMVLGMSQVGESLEVCHQLLDQRIGDFKKLLMVEGIAETDMYIDFISQAPIFAYEEEKSLFSKKYVKIPKGFELKKNIHIRYTMRPQADKIIKGAATSEIYDIIKVDYILNDKEKVLDEMRVSCVAIINDKAKDLSALNIANAVMLRTYEESHYCYYPLQRYETFMSYTPDNSKALSPTANLQNENAKINIYYNKLSDNVYDKVINPDVLEPVLQFTYTVRMKTVLKKNN